MRFKLLCIYFYFPVLQLIATAKVVASSSFPASERYSFSLTTFDPSGKLGQVERAVEAASNGVPIVAILRPSSVILASPKILPSPLISDDGTSRFVSISPEIVLGHSGLSADGRVVLKAAQTLAIQHKYTFDEEIGIRQFLQELSLLFQEYTIKAAARPFGCTVVVAHVPADGDGQPSVYQVLPSGIIREASTREPSFIVNGLAFQRTPLLSEKLQQLGQQQGDVEDDCRSLAKAVRRAISEYHRLETNNAPDKRDGCVGITTASLCREGGFAVDFFDENDNQQL